VHVAVTELARQRRARGLTQRELAALVGVKPPTLSAVENGWQSPWPKLRAACAAVLDVAEDDLFPRDERGPRRLMEASSR
jgi:transcriptional regulator with XRE-family HTH domain